MKCESCGMPMKSRDDHGAKNVDCKYCKYCAPDGNLRGREDIREGWINALIEMDDLSAEEARRKVDSLMPTMPAWKGK